MLFDNYSTVAAEASLDALWMKTQVIANNIANSDTPGYKVQDVSFEEVLGRAKQAMHTKDNPSRQASAAQAQGRNLSREASAAQGQTQNSGAAAVFRTRIVTESGTDVRVDGNNISLEREQTELWKSYAQYSYLLDRVRGHYNNISNAISAMRT